MARERLQPRLPLFEKKMLSRSSRAVLGSREKAKEMHSNLALQPARKKRKERLSLIYAQSFGL